MATANPNITERRQIADRRTLDKATSRTMNAIDWLAIVLLIVGGINWGLIGLFGVDLVIALFGETRVTGLVYTLVGLAALWSIYTCTKLADKT